MGLAPSIDKPMFVFVSRKNLVQIENTDRIPKDSPYNVSFRFVPKVGYLIKGTRCLGSDELVYKKRL